GLIAATTLSGAQPDPIAQWRFDESIGALNFQAQIGNHPGTLNGAELVRASYRGHALLNHGDESYASVAGAESLLSGDDWSVSLWYRQNTQTDGGSRLRTVFASGNAGSAGIAISAERGSASNLQFRIGSSEVYLP